MKDHNSNYFTPMEIDAIGEIMNISLGSSATAMSEMLGKKVLITTPSVHVRNYDDLEIEEMQPAVGVEITYITGISGNNLMVLKRDDVRKILEILMYTEIDPETFQLDELSLSAVCELMNQMMGASATALADVIGTMVNISTPVAFEVDNADEFKRKYFKEDEDLVEVYFNIDIEDTFSSTFITMFSIDLCKSLIESFGFMAEENPSESSAPQPTEPTSGPVQMPAASGELSQADIDAMLAGAAGTNSVPQAPLQTPPPQVAPQQAAAPQGMPQMAPQQGMMPQGYPQQPMYAPPYPYTDPRLINVQPVYQNYEMSPTEAGTNLDLIMKVPLQISVEIGRTKKLVKEILELGQGSLVVLDKLAGDQVDVYVNGQCIAKGDVVVVDDNFGVKITEVIKKADLINSL
ncbi:flagellar motor switch phosphatase FliY [Clostridium aminobutyricum]|uniref:Flagellar motor switch phosphatase FliY n=1 Tax=Clostridium aminobutyricum TaxID=33953 RepID=A0A939D9M6_CLOAM|nr:flagellar motor switch phosphatase FliY [Clostridium aminobutyricum]MBN7773761.1 flagellar motor switch phosphatase FliY [Clostridium aminobutyricum]